jgi:hypothetical protein
MRLIPTLPLVLAALVPAPLVAQALSREEQAALAPISEYHFDQVFRENGFEAYKRGDFEWARRHFLSAARYADKTSQLALSTIHANGEGVPRDLALAYAWADLAAERGFPKFVARREQLWAMLDAAAQARAIEEGGKLYAEYGDAVAKPRHAKQLARVTFRSMGRRPSLRGAVDTYVYSGCSGSRNVAGGGLGGGSCFVPDYFEDENWAANDYWRVQDSVWGGGSGEVEVSPLRRPDDPPR